MAQPFKDPKSGRFFVSFSYRNKRYKRSTGSSSLATARRAQRIIDGRVSQLKAGLASLPAGVKVEEFVFDDKQTPDEPSEALTVAGFIDQYLQEASSPPAKAASTHLLEKIHTAHLQDYADGQGKAMLAELDRAFFEAYKRWRHSAGVKNVTINKELSTFRAMMNWGVRAGLVAANPLNGVPRLKNDEVFDRFRTGPEIQELLQSGDYSGADAVALRRFRYLDLSELADVLQRFADSEIHAFVAVAVYTGMRLSEIRRLRWADVDFGSERILARGYKGSQHQRESARYISLHPDLATILRDYRESHPGVLVFGDSDGNERTNDYFYHRFRKVTDGSPFEGIGFHCFRHSFASNLAAQGVDQRVIDRFMGHQTEAMRQRYQHLFPDRMQEAIGKLELAVEDADDPADDAAADPADEAGS
jgi:integrase